MPTRAGRPPTISPRSPATPPSWPTGSRRPSPAGWWPACAGCTAKVSASTRPTRSSAAERAGAEAAADIGPKVRALLALDIDEQTTNPLSIVRGATRYPTEVLHAAAVPPVDRDATARRQFPDDDYDLTPGFFADLDPDLHGPGLTWGAAKAHVHLARRRAAGQR